MKERKETGTEIEQEGCVGLLQQMRTESPNPIAHQKGLNHGEMIAGTWSSEGRNEATSGSVWEAEVGQFPYSIMIGQHNFLWKVLSIYGATNTLLKVGIR